MATSIQLRANGCCAGMSKDCPSSLGFSSGRGSKVVLRTAFRFAGVKVGSTNWKRRVVPVCCDRTVCRSMEKDETVTQDLEGIASELSIVMKFGGSSVATADRMREVAELILSFLRKTSYCSLRHGKTTNNLLLAGESAVSCGVSNASDIAELNSVKQLHLKTINELGIDGSSIFCLLDELEQLLKGIAMMKELTPRTTDYLVSFGECMSTRIFAEYLRKLGVKARQYDAFDIGFITSDDFTNADILEATYPALAKKLHSDWIVDPAIPVVTGFIERFVSLLFFSWHGYYMTSRSVLRVSPLQGWKSCAVTTLGRGGSDLTATTIGKALGLREIQVWKDVDGVLTCDPNICSNARPIPCLTFEEAAELAYFGSQV
ncbi:hypothetical protein HPP92_001686 [Vanilla planifolia]|uniref:Aspartate/glutamate/uridylate kinase domain-containing protein n=1 Tax=Vanilla planifolia TaxID=51239 RepID=A0A835S511_VANPL|nr:hypothetical protein HPP92_001686 [Vanilla planifolia]